MEIVLGDTDLLMDVVESVRELVEYVNIVVHEDGLKIDSYDDTKTSLIKLHLKRDAFETYDLKQPSSMSVSTTFLLQCLKWAPEKSRLKMRRKTVNEGDGILYLEFTGSDGRVSKCEMTLFENDQDVNVFPITNIEGNHIHLPSKEWTNIMRDFRPLCHIVNISVTSADAAPARLRFAFSDPELGKGATAIEGSTVDGDTYRMEIREPMSDNFLMTTLANFRSPRNSTQCHLTISASNVLELVYDLGDNAKFGIMKFFLAPQTKSEDM